MSLFSHKCLDPTYCPSLKSFFVISNFLGQDDEPLYIYSCIYIYINICIHISQNPRRLRDPQKMAIYVCFLHDLLWKKVVVAIPNKRRLGRQCPKRAHINQDCHLCERSNILSFHGRPHQLLTSQTLGEYYIKRICWKQSDPICSWVSCFMFHGLSEIALEPRSFRNLPSQGQLKERSRQSALLHFFLFGKDTFFFKEMWRLKNLSWLFLEVIASDEIWSLCFWEFVSNRRFRCGIEKKNESLFFFSTSQFYFGYLPSTSRQTPLSKGPFYCRMMKFLSDRELPPFLEEFFRALK